MQQQNFLTAKVTQGNRLTAGYRRQGEVGVRSPDAGRVSRRAGRCDQSQCARSGEKNEKAFSHSFSITSLWGAINDFLL